MSANDSQTLARAFTAACAQQDVVSGACRGVPQAVKAGSGFAPPPLPFYFTILFLVSLHFVCALFVSPCSPVHRYLVCAVALLPVCWYKNEY